MKKQIFLSILACLFTFVSWSQSIIGVWFNDAKDAKIEIYKAEDGRYYGKIVWLKEPLSDGYPKVDKNNSNKSLKSRPILGLIVLSGLVKKDDGFESGTIYDPKTGKSYTCSVKVSGTNLNIRGYLGLSLIGKTTTWTKTN